MVHVNVAFFLFAGIVDSFPFNLWLFCRIVYVNHWQTSPFSLWMFPGDQYVTCALLVFVGLPQVIVFMLDFCCSIYADDEVHRQLQFDFNCSWINEWCNCHIFTFWLKFNVSLCAALQQETVKELFTMQPAKLKGCCECGPEKGCCRRCTSGCRRGTMSCSNICLFVCVAAWIGYIVRLNSSAMWCVVCLAPFSIIRLCCVLDQFFLLFPAGFGAYLVCIRRLCEARVIFEYDVTHTCLCTRVLVVPMSKFWCWDVVTSWWCFVVVDYVQAMRPRQCRLQHLLQPKLPICNRCTKNYTLRYNIVFRLMMDNYVLTKSFFFVLFPFLLADCRIHEKWTRNTVERIQGTGDRGDVSLFEFGTSTFHHLFSWCDCAYFGWGILFWFLLRYHHRPSYKSWPWTRYGLVAATRSLRFFLHNFVFLFNCWLCCVRIMLLT